MNRPATLFVWLIVFLSLAGGCATTAPVSEPPSGSGVQKNTVSRPLPEKRDGVRRSEERIILPAGATDSYESLAEAYLGDRKLAYIISEFNDGRPIVPGGEVVIPLKAANPGGLYADGYQTVPVLCYHQFSTKGSGSKVTVTEQVFDRQMAYLKNNGYTVITLQQLYDFIDYKRRPPPKSVIITIDDGWKTVKTIAYPILKKYGFSAVLFVYTDLIKAKQSSVTLSWDDVREMVESGVIEIGSHTVTHADLSKLREDQVRRELQESQRIIRAKTGVTTIALAYPYGNFSDSVVEALHKYDYKVGFSVIRGANAFFHHPYALNRSMVFNSEKIEDFVKQLETFKRDQP